MLAKESKGIKKKFKENVKQVNIQCEVQSRLDVSTRWNFIYLMLQSALKNICAFNPLKVCDSNFKSRPSDQECVRAKMILELLLPFFQLYGKWCLSSPR